MKDEVREREEERENERERKEGKIELRSKRE